MTEGPRRSACPLCRALLARVIRESRFWRTAINHNQNLLGKLIIVLRRHEEAVAELTDDEWTDLRRQVRRATGRLAAAFTPITPQAVFSASEVLTGDVRAAAKSAWGREPFNVYAATETAGIASECQERHLHCYDDLVIAESGDEDNQPVAPGQSSAKLLVTALFSRTQPLIRYVLTDRVRIHADGARDLGPFSRLVQEVEGRTEDVLALPATSGREVMIHPNLFHGVLERADAPWQVIRHQDSIEVLVAGHVDAAAMQLRLTSALASAGAAPIAVMVKHVESIPRTALGKAPRVRVAA